MHKKAPPMQQKRGGVDPSASWSISRPYYRWYENCNEPTKIQTESTNRFDNSGRFCPAVKVTATTIFDNSIFGVVYVPVCRPLRFASFRSVTRARECTTVGFFIIRPSRYNLATFRRELANAISLISLGSNHTLRLPHFKTSAANRFCNFNETTNNTK